MSDDGALPQRRPGRARPPPPRADETYYKVLGVDAEADDFIVEAAYRALMRRHHPDRGGETWQAQAINDGYSILRSPASRALYDEALAKRRAAPVVAAGGPFWPPTPPRPSAPPRPPIHPAQARRRAWLISHAYMVLAAVLLVAALLSAGRSLGWRPSGLAPRVHAQTAAFDAPTRLPWDRAARVLSLK